MLYHYQKQRFDIRKETRCVCVAVCVGVCMDVCTVHVCVWEIQQHIEYRNTDTNTERGKETYKLYKRISFFLCLNIKVIYYNYDKRPVSKVDKKWLMLLRHIWLLREGSLLWTFWRECSIETLLRYILEILDRLLQNSRLFSSLLQVVVSSSLTNDCITTFTHL